MIKIIDIVRNFLSRLSKREKTVLYAAVVCVSLVGIDRLVIGPITYKITSLDDQIRQKENSINKSLHMLSQKDRIKEEKAQYESFLNDPTPRKEIITSVLKEVEIIANKASVYLGNLKPIEGRSEGQPEKYEVSLNCEAEMRQIADFIYSIEQSNKLLIIEKFEAGPASKKSTKAKCSMTISKMTVP